MSKDKRIPLSKIYRTRLLFGIPEDFRDRVSNYPDYFRVVVENDGRRVLELVNCDPALAVSQLEKDFVLDEDKVKSVESLWQSPRVFQLHLKSPSNLVGVTSYWRFPCLQTKTYKPKHIN
ncbi:Plant organelle RNA recognition domain [Dillenia turbinata]|uniref:Plant organelle RNA recognition domain n=1 Tax=Dillenia turbinata TaxID=194707 RepID=A0AAN8VXZ2_9MAGN